MLKGMMAGVLVVVVLLASRKISSSSHSSRHIVLKPGSRILRQSQDCAIHTRALALACRTSSYPRGLRDVKCGARKFDVVRSFHHFAGLVLFDTKYGVTVVVQPREYYFR